VTGATPRRTAVIDLGSNTFRLVVFEAAPEGWWRQSDAIPDRVRIGEGADATGRLGEAPMERAIAALALYGRYCRAQALDDIRPMATSAIRDAENGTEFLERAEEALGRSIQVLSAEEEARYGVVAALYSSTIADGAVLDLGGGSLQLSQVRDRKAGEAGSWPLGAVRMTERFLPGGEPKKAGIKALRKHVGKRLRDARWLGEAERLVAMGGTARNLAAAALHRAERPPDAGIQGVGVSRDALAELVDAFAGANPGKRAEMPGVSDRRADVILAGALTVLAVLEETRAEAFEVTEWGMREGVFLSAHEGAAIPSPTAVRRRAVEQLAHRFSPDLHHPRQVAELAAGLWSALDGAQGDRELVWAAGMLRDVGTAVDIDDRHKHTRYIVENAGLPGFTPREVAIVASAARYQRKGSPGLDHPAAEAGDEDRLARIAVVLRLAGDLDRARDGAVTEVRTSSKDGIVRLAASGNDVGPLLEQAVRRHGDLFEDTFDKELRPWPTG
jgi:exopolyphosphatase/guanosine-5'-triphosphate,3'-diphosphate pyrophosphatase